MKKCEFPAPNKKFVVSWYKSLSKHRILFGVDWFYKKEYDIWDWNYFYDCFQKYFMIGFYFFCLKVGFRVYFDRLKGEI